MKKVLLAWSSGKDSAWTLQVLRESPEIEVIGLFTTVREGAGRVAVHEVREELVDAQARAADLPLHRIPLPQPCPNSIYEFKLKEFFEQQTQVTHAAFGDLFLEDIRRYRERQFAALGLELLFPLWGRPTRELAEEMIEGGLRAWVTSVDTRQAPRALAGQLFDAAFLRALPVGVDPCGERGEFHTFAFAGPMFSAPIACRAGAVYERDGFAYADVLSSAEW